MESFIGEISLFGGNYAPVGWEFCHGQLMEIAKNPTLFGVLGTQYGGNGRTDFRLPDLRGRIPIGTNQGGNPDTPYCQQGSRGGTEYEILTANQIPPHEHVYSAEISVETNLACGASSGTSNNPKLHYFGQSVRGDKLYANALTNPVEMNDAAGMLEVQMRGETLSAGSGQSHTNMAPFIVMNYIICTQGIFPG